MKNKLWVASTMILFIASFYMLSSFGKPENKPESAGNEMEQAAFFAVGPSLHYDFQKDTLTNAAKDTIPIGPRSSVGYNVVARPTNFFSLYTYDISVVRANLSGTTSVKLYLDKSNTYNPSPTSGSGITDWFTIDSTSTTTATTAMMRSTDATGFRYRIRVVGAGTQSSTYQIRSAWKQKN